jgi:oligosaccharide reducing-end xylanase
MTNIFRTVILIALFCAPMAAQDMQKLNLPINPTTFRFTPATRAWPASHGQAAVCWWHNDAVAALSITIDDNQVAEHSWWKAQGERLGFRFTWFAITGILNLAGWNSFRDLVAAGHDVQSHTVNHVGVSGMTAAQCSTEYLGAIARIESEIPNYKCLTLAYPNGLGLETEAAKYYIAARGVYGEPNIAYKTWYLNTNSMHFNDSYVDKIMNRTVGGLFWGGWLSIHTHNLSSDGGATVIQANLDHIAMYKDSLWVGLWKDVARYGQSRDTKTLTVNSVADNMVRYTLADSMRDSIYNFPLTVKVRLDNTWDTCLATQNGRAVEARMVTYSGKKYALVKTVPDNGEVTLYSGQASGIIGRRTDGTAANTRVLWSDLSGRRLGGGMMTGLPTGIYLLRAEGATTFEKRLIVR